MARQRLVAFPYAGSGPSAYLGWMRLLPESIELRPVAPPGCEVRDGEPPETDLERYLSAVVAELLAQPPLPVALFGHSLGGSIAYEAALRLQQAGRPAAHLFISAKEPPEVPLQFPDLHLRDDAGVLDGLRALNGDVPDELVQDPVLLASVLLRLRADWTLMSQVRDRPVPALTAPVTVLWSPDDPSTVESELRRWDRRVAGNVAYEAFRGGHLFLNQQAPEVVRCILARLGTGDSA